MNTMKEVMAQLEHSLCGLKDFQRATVDRVVDNFNSEGHSQRILVADEVGLGKTIVAKGVIARLLIEKIKGLGSGSFTKRPMRVTYICSNLALANENRQKLALFDPEARARYVQEPTFGRLLELATQDNTPADDKKLLEVCSLTPSTSFTLTQSHGNVWERYILFSCLMQAPELNKHRDFFSKFFQGDVKDKTWEYQESWLVQSRTLNQDVVIRFQEKLKAACSVIPQALKDLVCGDIDTCLDGLIQLGEKFDYLSDNTCGYECWPDIIERRDGIRLENVLFYRLRSHLRHELARVCAAHLTADLFILDEFQRFNALLDIQSDTEDALIAHEVFANQSSKILLLSATPFKALTRIEDDECESAHHEELQHLLQFLNRSDSEHLNEYDQARKALLAAILQLREADFCVESLDSMAKERVERALQPYICRTERSQIGDNLDSVLMPDPEPECLASFTAQDIKSYKAMAQLADALKSVTSGHYGHQLIEFYKSAPWALSFLSGYAFKERLEQYLVNPDIKDALRQSSPAWLSRSDIKNYRLKLAEKAPNAKFRRLLDVVFKDRSEELLWVPPSCPHYPLEGAFKTNSAYTKTLLFSSWALVPRAISGLLSYEAERRLQKKQGNKRAYFRKHDEKFSPLVRFEGKAALTGWSLIYPSKTLVNVQLRHGSMSLKEILEEKQKHFRQQLSKLEIHCNGSKSKTLWYSLAPMLLDLANGDQTWLDSWLAEETKRTNTERRKVHLGKLQEHLEQATEGCLELGEMPDDLAEYLALLSVAGPGVCALRMLSALWQQPPAELAKLASELGAAVVQVFNKPESALVLRKSFMGNEHWRHILCYCANGALQAMLDEFAHLLQGAGLSAQQAVARIKDVTGFRTASIACQFEEDKHVHLGRDNKSESMLRCHFAVPLGNQKATDDSQIRVENIRDAFNSPFRPFVLNSTSIGQEGLDFHWYCSRVVHWNIPANPIDIEQREGRVNRYKSLVVRRRVAETIKTYLPTAEEFDKGSYWHEFFRHAMSVIPEKKSELVPYWHMPTGSAKIERIIPMMPFSREVHRYDEALKILVLYRLAFGQPRQEELLANLLKRQFTEDEHSKISEALVINLAPILGREQRHEGGYS